MIGGTENRIFNKKACSAQRKGVCLWKGDTATKSLYEYNIFADAFNYLIYDGKLSLILK